MENKPEDFKSYHRVTPKKENSYSWTSVGVLPELLGKPWNEITMCYVLSLEPTSIRVSAGVVTLDGSTGRITVIVDDSNIINEIYKEVRIPVPSDMNAYDLRKQLEALA